MTTTSSYQPTSVTRNEQDQQGSHEESLSLDSNGSLRQDRSCTEQAQPLYHSPKNIAPSKQQQSTKLPWSYVIVYSVEQALEEQELARREGRRVTTDIYVRRKCADQTTWDYIELDDDGEIQSENTLTKEQVEAMSRTTTHCSSMNENSNDAILYHDVGEVPLPSSPDPFVEDSQPQDGLSCSPQPPPKDDPQYDACPLDTTHNDASLHPPQGDRLTQTDVAEPPSGCQTAETIATNVHNPPPPHCRDGILTHLQSYHSIQDTDNVVSDQPLPSENNIHAITDQCHALESNHMPIQECKPATIHKPSSFFVSLPTHVGTEQYNLLTNVPCPTQCPFPSSTTSPHQEPTTMEAHQIGSIPIVSHSDANTLPQCSHLNNSSGAKRHTSLSSRFAGVLTYDYDVMVGAMGMMKIRDTTTATMDESHHKPCLDRNSTSTLVSLSKKSAQQTKTSLSNAPRQRSTKSSSSPRSNPSKKSKKRSRSNNLSDDEERDANYEPQTSTSAKRRRSS